MKILSKLRLHYAGSLKVIVSITLILMTGMACQSKKRAKGPSKVGENVQMAELRQVIHSQVPDLNRASALINMVGFAERELGAINESYHKYSKEFGKISANHSKSANDLHLVLREWETQTSARRLRITNTLLAMKGQATAEEWPAISRAFLHSVTQQSDRYRDLHPSNS